MTPPSTRLADTGFEAPVQPAKAWIVGRLVCLAVLGYFWVACSPTPISPVPTHAASTQARTQGRYLSKAEPTRKLEATIRPESFGPQPTMLPEEPAPPSEGPSKPKFKEKKSAAPSRQPASDRQIALPSVRQLGLVKLYFATDRKWTGAQQQPKWFGSDWNDAKEHLTYGTCKVSIPVGNHAVGIVEKRSIARILVGAAEDPKRDVMVRTSDRLERPAFFEALAAEVRQRDEKEIIVFIHGFNNTFDDAASRLGVLAYDMEFNGVPVLYSWSSEGGPWGWNPRAYRHDERIVTLTEDPLTDFLASVTQAARKAGAQRVNVVAHSMGNRPLVAALRKLAERQTDKITIDEVVMAAPDVAEESFAKEQWPHLQPHGPARRITLYASSDDQALAMSRRLHGGLRRIGEAGPNLLLLPGLDTIDASGCDFHRLGLNHTYFGGLRVISDLAKIIQKGLTPLDRQLLGKTRHQLGYWLLPELIPR